MSFSIPLKNKKGDVVARTIVSEEDYKHLSNFKWYFSNNYIRGKVDGKDWLLHRYIIIKILQNDLTPKQPIDHINNNTLDNTRYNLRISTPSNNSRNRVKKENTSSKYIGVSKNGKKWSVSIKINCKKISAYYEYEIHAAHQYNLWLKEFNIITDKINNIDIPTDFIIWKRLDKKGGDLPKGIIFSKNKFNVTITYDKIKKHLGNFNNLQDAIKVRKNAEIYRDEYLKNKLYNLPILYNENNDCIFKIKNTEIIIDKDIYYDIIKNKWQLDKDNYSQGFINGKTIKLHRYIMNYYGDNYIDHINNNRLDNRKSNLRIVTPKQNCMNRKSSLNNSSKYVGVSFNLLANKWEAYIHNNGTKINLGLFQTELEAANSRNEASEKFFGEYANLNVFSS